MSNDLISWPVVLIYMYRLMEQIVTRQEVWKYRKVFDGYERDWLKVPFKRLDIGIISEKVLQQYNIMCFVHDNVYDYVWMCSNLINE